MAKLNAKRKGSSALDAGQVALSLFRKKPMSREERKWQDQKDQKGCRSTAMRAGICVPPSWSAGKFGESDCPQEPQNESPAPISLPHFVQYMRINALCDACSKLDQGSNSNI